jgi:hypothetical protein
MNNVYREHAIDASYQVSVHLAKWFQRRRFLKIGQSETRIAYGGHAFISKNKCQLLQILFCTMCGNNWSITLKMTVVLNYCIIQWIYIISKLFKNQPIRNKNCLWWPCLITDQDEMNNVYREHAIDASYQVSVHLASSVNFSHFNLLL